MTHQDLEDVIPLYAIGTLERTERQAIEAHLLSGCVPCHTALKEYQSRLESQNDGRAHHDRRHGAGRSTHGEAEP
jgi:hypothetical protein